MRRKRIVAKLMALSLLFSGLPMTSVYAAELPEPMEAVEQEVEGEETPVEDSAIEDTDEKEMQDENAVTDETQQGDPGETEATEKIEAIGEIKGVEVSSLNDGETVVKELQTAENARMAGSNGILYDGVTYLSARNVLAMDEEMQESYRSLCDEIAASKDGGLEMQNVVFAVAANGDLYCSYYVPLTALEEIQADMLPDADGTLTPDTEESSVEEKKDDETSEEGKDAVEEEKKDDEASADGKDAAEEEKKDDEASEDAKDAVEEEKKDDETSADGKDAAEEKKDDETSEDGKDAVEEEKKEAETSADDEDALEEKEAEGIEDEQAAEEESYELVEENLDLIPEMEEETFEEIESFKIENTIDLGYGNGVTDELSRSGIQFNAILPTENYFVNQLTASQKTYYDLAKAKLTKGSNKLSYTGLRSLSSTIGNDIAHAVSALILAYPDKTDWMAKPGGFNGIIAYRPGSSVGTYTFTFDKSQYYSGSLDSRAKTQMQTVGNLAQQYAAENYPNTPVYGIVKYLDQWVCENGYYEMLGTAPLSGDKNLDKTRFGLNNSEIEILYRVYYNCHSAYGILLEGYGVCESYAKTMSRLLDAIGIPNIYVVGTAGSGRDAGGHAWNYVQMPNGSWYLLDSTWNDTTDPKHTTSNGSYVLVKEDGEHHETGCNYSGEDVVMGKFSFPARAGSNYAPSSTAESITLSKTTCDLAPRAKEKLTCTIANSDSYGKVSAVWSSSNTKVATVDQKGNVTAKAAGTADITVSAAGMKATCRVYVDQIKAVKTADNKTSESVSLGNTAAAKGSKTITLTVDMGTSPHTAEWMIANDAKTTAPVVTSSKTDVVKAAATVTGNSIVVKIDALQDGSSKVTVKFGGKTVTINVTAGQIITQDMFDVTWPDGATADKTYAYTGKAIKPTVKKKEGDAYKPVTFKTTYVNNVNAGTAKVVLTGTGKYGGVLEYPFTITPIDITGADFSNALKSKVYNGGDNPPATVVKLEKKTLKVNKDYEILYNGVKPAGALAAGTYTVSIRGIGNYTGTVKTTQSYEVTKNTIAKVTASGASSAKYTGLQMNPYTVKIGKNVLPGSDYTITWYQGQGKNLTPMNKLPLAKGKYTAVIKVRGNNLTNTDKKTEIIKNFTIK